MYNTETFSKPFWAENSGFMTGRDPLGVQNSSITTYGRLLPGLTNLTLRLRYYGLYLWLLSVYDKQTPKRSESKLNGHYNFIRRAELIIAFIMRKNHPDELSIIGSDYTNKREGDINEVGFYNIKLGADKNINTIKGSVYWDYPSGALGQYYAGSLMALNLIETSNKFFIIQDEGKKLANAFELSIHESQRSKFLEIINTGRLYEEDINQLDAFSIGNIILNSAEWHYYQKMLLDIDGIAIMDNTGITTSLRRETITLYLEYIEKNDVEFNERSFITWQYILNLNERQNDASFGWYYYFINEAFHIALETVFWSMLVQLDGKEQKVDKFIKELKDLVTTSSSNLFGTEPDTPVLELIISNENLDLVKEIQILENEVKSTANIDVAIARAFKLMYMIYQLNNDRIVEIIEFEKKYKISWQKGRVSENLNLYIENSLNAPFSSFVEETIKRILNDHVNTAYRKMGNGESNLLKFIIEDGIISHVQTMDPRHTSPRLRTISNFLKDLKLVDTNNNLTRHGKDFLKTIN